MCVHVCVCVCASAQVFNSACASIYVSGWAQLGRGVKEETEWGEEIVSVCVSVFECGC
jgi:hypothetical protein